MTMSKPHTLNTTFSCFADGSGAEAIITLRNGQKIALTRNSKPETKWHVLENWQTGTRGRGGKQGLGYGKEAGMSLSEIKKAIIDFNSRLTPEWLALNAALYNL
jgi:hypothetical protein